MAVEVVSIPVQQRLLCNKAELAEAFKVSVASVDAWLRRGCPHVQRGNRGAAWVFNIIDVAEWRFGGTGDADGATTDPENMSPKERLDWYKGTRERLALERERGEMVSADEVAEAWEQQIAVAKGRLLSLPTRIAPELLGLGETRDIERTLKTAITSVLEELANEQPSA